MGSTFSGLEIGKRGLSAHQQALKTTAHNISNADNKNYARQRVNLTAADPLYEPSLNRANVAGQIGQGVEIASIERVRDSFIDDRIIETGNKKSYWDTRKHYLNQVENIFNEPNGITLRSLMNEFWSAWEDLSNYPEESAHRAVVQEKAHTLGSRTEDVFRKLDQLRNETNRAIENNVNALNSLASSIASLNDRINKAETLGDMPNDLYDKRDAAMQELSGLADINVGRGDKDEMMIFVGQQILVQGQFAHKINLVPDAAFESKVDLRWDASGDNVLLRSGSLQALIEIRDQVLREKIDMVDALAVNVTDSINEIHKDGFGSNGKTNVEFFASRSLAANSAGEYDNNGDGINDITAIFRVSGKFSVNPERPVEISGNLILGKDDKTTVTIPYNEKDTLRDVIKRINTAGAGVVAYMNHDNQLAIKATVAEDNSRNNFIIRHVEDSGQLLVGLTGLLRASGPEGAYDYRKLGEINKFQVSNENITLTPHYHPSSFFKLGDEVENNAASIAAARGKDINGTGDYNTANGQKDGSNALLIAQALRGKPIMVNYTETTDDFYNSLISKLGTETREASHEFNTQNDLMVELENMRQSVMGVSLDEEMSNMVQFQHSYNASAKMISTMSEMLDVIINRMGV